MTRPLRAARVVLTNPIDPEAAAVLRERLQVVELTATDAMTVREAVRDADAVIVRAPLPDDVFDCGPRLLTAIRHGAGVDMIPVARASAAGVIVANVPGANAATVAEYAAGQMLQLARRLAAIDTRLRADGWAPARRLADTGEDLAGRTLGLVGTGAIGAALARIASAGFGMRVIGHRASDAAMPPHVTRVPLDALLAASDYVALTCPLTEATRGLLGPAEFGRLKPGARLVNVSRGPVVDEAALIAALASGRLAGAALDVFETQPLPEQSPLRAFPQVLLSPHMAGITVDSMRRMSERAVAQLFEVLQGRPPAHFVNPEVWPARRSSPFAGAPAP